jgi:hypothetical protein
MPLAEDGAVAFKKDNLIATSVAPKYVTKQYNKLVKELKELDFTFKDTVEKSKAFEIKNPKIVH